VPLACNVVLRRDRNSRIDDDGLLNLGDGFISRSVSSVSDDTRTLHMVRRWANRCVHATDCERRRSRLIFGALDGSEEGSEVLAYHTAMRWREAVACTLID
jgi:hypothetical protein